MKRLLQLVTSISIISLFLFSCNSNRFDVEVDDISLNVKFVNLDSTLQKATLKQIVELRNEFKRKKSDILDYNVGYCLHINLNNDTSFFNGKSRFYTNDYIKELETYISKNQILNSGRKSSIVNGLKRLKANYPNGKLPSSIYQINSSFSSSVFCTESEIAIGIERYLGPENKLIKQLPTQEFYNWIKESMRDEYLERDVFAAWLMTNYVDETTENFASEMIRWGKILYITQTCLPEIDERIILRYDKEQFDWANNSTSSFWKYLVKNEVLFKIDEETRMNLLKEGPHSIGLPQESPDRMGQFMGFQIVKSYMEDHDISLPELVKLPYNEILQKYKLD